MIRMHPWLCPGCGCQITVRSANWVGHECPNRSNRLTSFVKQLPDPEPQ